MTDCRVGLSETEPRESLAWLPLRAGARTHSTVFDFFRPENASAAIDTITAVDAFFLGRPRGLPDLAAARLASGSFRFRSSARWALDTSKAPMVVTFSAVRSAIDKRSRHARASAVNLRGSAATRSASCRALSSGNHGDQARA